MSRRVRAALAFLDILTLRPDDVGPADLDRARAEGLTDDAVRDVALVCALFSMITRLADTLNFAVPSSFDTTVRALTSRLGYRMPPPVFLLPRV